ncbi:DUF4214 domain-containing protein [Undibacterium sp. JH2W]|uniref:DUF4214 domain-containing protein n=1 Tax=Undibacterium sp. JH2W TaxID=3413037 RepID=UPI003BF29908
MANLASDIQKIYIAYFGRPADPDGLEYWMKQNFSLTQIADSFAQQAEYKSNFDGQTIDATLKLIYKNLFLHDADVSGLEYWSGQINKGVFSIGQAALAIANGAIGADAITLASKGSAAASFTAELKGIDLLVAYQYDVTGVRGPSIGRDFLSLVSSPATASLLTGYAHSIVTDLAIVPGGYGRDLINVLGLDLAQGTHFVKGDVSLVGGPGDDVFHITDAQYAMGTTIDGGAGADTLDLGVLTNSRNLSRVSNTETIVVNGGSADFFVNADGAGITLNITKDISLRILQLGSGGQTLNLLGTGSSHVGIIGSTSADTIKLSATGTGVDRIIAKGSLLGDGTPDTIFNFKAAAADLFSTGVKATSLNNLTIAAADTTQLASVINEAAASAGSPLNTASQAFYITIKSGTAAGNYAFENIGSNLSAVDAGDFIVKLVGNGSIVATDFVL